MSVTENPKAHAYMQKAKDIPGAYCVALNRPDFKNALSRQLLKELREAITSIAKNPS